MNLEIVLLIDSILALPTFPGGGQVPKSKLHGRSTRFSQSFGVRVSELEEIGSRRRRRARGHTVKRRTSFRSVGRVVSCQTSFGVRKRRYRNPRNTLDRSSQETRSTQETAASGGC